MLPRETIKNLEIHEILFYIFLFLIPIQTRILYFPEKAYINWYFNYHLAFFFYLTDILLIGVFASWLLFHNQEIKSTNKLFWLILAFFLVISISLISVKHIDLGIYQVLKWLEMLVLLLYVSQNFKTINKHRTSLSILFISGIIQALIGISQFHVQHSLNLGFLGEYIAPLGTSGLATINLASMKLIRSYGTFPHPNIYGAFLVLAMICGLFHVSHGTKAIKSAISLGIITILLGIFVSFSRLSWIAASLALISFVIYYWLKNQAKTALTIVILGLVSCATILLVYPNSLKARISDVNQTSITDRGTFNRYGLELIAGHLILGVGVGNYIPALQEKYHLEAWQYQPAHNIFIFIAAELGIIGLGIFIWVLFEILKRIKNIFSDPMMFTVYCLLFTFLAMGLFDHYFITIQQGRLMFFTGLGMAAAFPNIYDQKIN